MYIVMLYDNIITILYCIPFIHSLLCARCPANSDQLYNPLGGICIRVSSMLLVRSPEAQGG